MEGEKGKISRGGEMEEKGKGDWRRDGRGWDRMGEGKMADEKRGRGEDRKEGRGGRGGGG